MQILAQDPNGMKKWCEEKKQAIDTLLEDKQILQKAFYR